jgi:hypothetical protein
MIDAHADIVVDVVGVVWVDLDGTSGAVGGVGVEEAAQVEVIPEGRHIQFTIVSHCCVVNLYCICSCTGK